jgi:hypothetical protein
MITWFKSLWQTFLKNVGKTSEYRKVIIINQQPDKSIPNKTLIVVMGRNEPKWLIFKCPCGCGEVLRIPLMKSYNPHWDIYKEANSTITVFPSINIKKPGCGAHFWVRNNKVQWAK